MQHTHNESVITSAPKTAGRTLHQAAQYDFFTRLAGMGAKGANSRMVVGLAKIKPGDSVLDVACGTGNLTQAAQIAAGAEGKVYGIDASPEMIAEAQKKALQAGSTAVFQLGLAEKLDFPDNSFDVAISRLAIHHLPDDLKRQAFKEILRVLKPGGRLLIADFMRPGNHVLAHITQALVGPRMMNTDVWSLPGMVEQAGFVEVTSGPTRSSFLAYVSGKKGNQ